MGVGRGLYRVWMCNQVVADLWYGGRTILMITLRQLL